MIHISTNRVGEIDRSDMEGLTYEKMKYMRWLQNE